MCCEFKLIFFAFYASNIEHISSRYIDNGNPCIKSIGFFGFGNKIKG